MMSKHLRFQEMLNEVKEVMEGIPEHRRGQNKQYEIEDAGLSALSMFYMQSPSFLSWQQDMEKRKGRNNARSLFGIKKIPSDEQVKNLLDPVSATALSKAYWNIYHALEKRGQLQRYGALMGTQLVSIDGTQHHASQKVHCEQCRVTVRKEKAYYEHQVLLAVLCAPGQEHVMCLEPEFITPQDGHDKQDCEQVAIKRWAEKHASEFTPWSVTILADDLHCHQPTCALLLQHKMNFVLTCKQDSHQILYEELALLEQVEGAIGRKSERHWNGRHYERWVYRWAEQLPLRWGTDALQVNWCEWTVIDDGTGEQLYHCAWATNHNVNEQTVAAVTRSGRARWKVENEGINVLKNCGYHFKHNYGHGQQQLANVLLSFLLLAFLMHTVLHVGCQRYQAVRQSLGARRKFFQDLQALTRYLYFDSWQQLLTYMYQGLELEPD